MRLIALTGGIGSGKSVVAEALRRMGYPVYDCDSRAKALMDNDQAMKEEIARRVTPKALNVDNTLNRQAISEVVFADPKKLEALNSIVHGAVAADIARWCEELSQSRDMGFVETAILYQSGLDRMVDEVWAVTASEATRVARVMRRNNVERQSVEARIEAQRFTPENPHSRIHKIINDENEALLPQIERLLQ